MRLREIFDFLTRPLSRLWRNLVYFTVWLYQAPGRFWRRRFSADSSWLSVLAWPFLALSSLLIQPIKILRAGDAERSRHFLAGLPALLVLLGFLGAIGYAWVRQDTIANRYRARGRGAIVEKDYRSAKTFYGRLVNAGKDEGEDRFYWAVSLAETGDVQRAESILDQLAPPRDKGVGTPIAHRYRAVAQIASISRGEAVRDPRRLEEIRWHLENSGNGQAGDVDEPWALYYSFTGQLDRALPYFLRAANSKPEYLLVAAGIQKERLNTVAQFQTLQRAQRVFSSLLARDPMNEFARSSLAKTLVELNEVDQAQRVLEVGVKLKPTKEMRRALASLLLERHKQAVVSGDGFDKELGYLQGSLTLDPNNRASYEFLIGLRKRAGGDDLAEKESKSDRLKQLLDSIAKGESVALAHFALGNILWLDNRFDDAKFHLQQAYRLDDDFSIIANNLAWVLANQDPPNLDQAHQLVSSVVEREPDDPRFHDTLGMVLFRQENYADALLHLEKALDLSSDKRPVPRKPIHQQLAVVYAKLGQPEMARVHTRLAASDE